MIWIPTSWAPSLTSGSLASNQFEGNVVGNMLHSPDVRVFDSQDDNWIYFDSDGSGSAAPVRLAFLQASSFFANQIVHLYDLT